MRKLRISKAISDRICDLEDVDRKQRLRMGKWMDWVEFEEETSAEARQGNAPAKVRRLAASIRKLVAKVGNGEGRIEIE